jgi:hypothetical protein
MTSSRPPTSMNHCALLMSKFRIRVRQQHALMEPGENLYHITIRMMTVHYGSRFKEKFQEIF